MELEKNETIFMCILPGIGMYNESNILNIINNNELGIMLTDKITLSEKQAEILYEKEKDQPNYKSLIIFLTKKPASIMILANRKFEKLRKIEKKIKKIYKPVGVDEIVYISNSKEDAKKHISIFFPES